VEILHPQAEHDKSSEEGTNISFGLLGKKLEFQFSIVMEGIVYQPSYFLTNLSCHVVPVV